MDRPWRTLVDAASLAKALRDDPDRVVVLDVRHDLKDPEKGPRLWAAGHVPGAFHAHVDRDLSAPMRPQTGRHPLPDIDAFLETCSRWGIDASVQVVAYDDWGGAWASRAWWLLRYYGHEAVAVLDGGIQAWTEAGLPLGAEVPKRAPRHFAGRPGQMPTVTTWELTTRAPRCLVDARAGPRYRGDEEPIDPVGGHIPHAINLPFSGNNDATGRFLPAPELRDRYQKALAGARPQDVAFYCGSGVTAPHDILAMEIAGLPGAALYPGSWSEWIRNPMRPVEKG
ncbi:MAG: thiosulfate/3-mercaptopyruvate sulfurtransferase [Thermoplasmata archaeon]|nr:thiosulfate/3-mercaptopyruvate sulfurtransferase [Thermoplasmata archaeon]